MTSNVALQPPPRREATRKPQALLAAVGCKRLLCGGPLVNRDMSGLSANPC